MYEEKVCCICNEHKKFLALINTGKKYYCMQCQIKITKEYGSDYWKPCSFEEGLENMLSDMRKGKGKRKPRNMFNNMRETIRKFEEEEKNKEKK